MTERKAGEGLKIEGVRHRFGASRLLEDISLTVAPGELVCLLGPSGCGKTTLLRIVAGLERLQEGRISINGRVVADGGPVNVPPEQRSTSLLFQDFALFPHLTVMENVTFGLSHLSRADAVARAEEVLAQVGMLNYRDAYPHVLSGGQQQRVALARARAPRPPVFLMDEPFSNLDVALVQQIRDVVLHVLKNAPSSTLFVTHNPEDAMFMADRIAVMRDGRIEQMGTPHTLYCHPASAYVAGLFTETNRMQGVVADGHVATPLGRICAPDFGEGAAVEVLIRPEAIQLRDRSEDGGPPGRAKVLAARMLGSSSMVHLSVSDGATPVHLHARIPGHRLPAENSEVPVVLDQSQVFVFPPDARK